MRGTCKFIAGIAGLALASLLSATGAVAAVTVSCASGTDSNCTSSTMGGRWDQNFGNDEHNCLYLLSTSNRNQEDLIGPEVIETDNSLTCLGGLEATNLVGMGNVQVRVFAGNDPQSNAYAWSWNESSINTSAAQFIPDDCAITDFDSTNPVNVRNGTFDNGDTGPTGPRPIIEPLSLEFTLTSDVKGNATISYYFMQGANDCRILEWTLKVDGAVVDSGPMADFALGKYLVFDFEGLEGGEVVLLELVDNDDGTCNTISPNSTVSGLFISGTSVCGYCGDGYWDRETEECDGSDPTDPNAEICSSRCTLPAPSRTLGYWKNHPTVIDGSFDGAGGQPSLLPLRFCGEAISEPCDAVEYLRKGGGGKKKFMRQGMAALLNCTAFDCPNRIRRVIREGSDACATGADYRYGRAGSILGTFNEANDDLPLPFQSPSALPKYCNGD